MANKIYELMLGVPNLQETERETNMDLRAAQEGIEYTISRIETDDEELDSFLFSLGCYSGEPITVISRKRNSCTVAIKDARYNIDLQLAEAIIVEP